jgi:methylase of polypeptide subunit release factors
VAEAPDPGVSVQIARDDDAGTVSLIFMRQVVEQVEDWLEPIGGVVCEITFQQGDERMLEFDVWSFDAANFDRFVDIVESSVDFEKFVLAKRQRSSVYWLET